MNTLTRQDVVRMLRGKVSEVGGVTQLARAWGLSRMYVYDVLKGDRTPGPKVLSRLGVTVERVTTVTYRMKPGREKSLTTP